MMLSEIDETTNWSSSYHNPFHQGRFMTPYEEEVTFHIRFHSILQNLLESCGPRLVIPFHQSQENIYHLRYWSIVVELV